MVESSGNTTAVDYGWRGRTGLMALANLAGPTETVAGVASVRLRLEGDGHDEDPLPRPAPVGSGSAFSAVSCASVVRATSIAIGDGRDLPARRLQALRTWHAAAASISFPIAPALEDIVRAGDRVALPESWSRRDPALADFRGPVWYGRELTVVGTHARLFFERADYVATVFVDGHERAVHEGGFTPVAVDIPAGRSSVTVRVDDPEETALLVPSPIFGAKRKIKGIHEQHDSRPGGMAVGAGFKRLWSRRWGTGGLCGPVWLHETGQCRLDAFVTAEPGSLRLSFVVDNLGSEVDAQLIATIAGASVTAAARLPQGPSRVAVRLAVDGARSWSIANPTLHHLRAAVVVDGQVSDSQDVEVGFRRVEMRVAGEKQFQLSLNGQRTYVRAANYIPGVFPAELARATVTRDLELARAAHLNSLGVHAGVQPYIAAVADQSGLLLYQDFPLQWSYDADGGPLFEGGRSFADASLELAAEMVYTLYNHPSIVYWCVHNEPAYQLAEAFADGATGEFSPLVERLRSVPDEEALDERRRALIASIDPTRPCNSASGLGFARADGDAHDYSGSLGGGHVTAARAGRTAFFSEYGAWSSNFSAAATHVAARGDWPPPQDTDNDWDDHTHIVAIQHAYAGRPDRYPDFQTWCFAGQLWAGWHTKVATEMARLAMWAPSAAHRYHFLVDHWGDAGAGVVDRHRQTGPAYRALAAANRPVLPLAPLPVGGRIRPGERVVLPIVVVNDLPGDLPSATLSWRLARLEPGDSWLIGCDEAPARTRMAPRPRADQCAVIPRRVGAVIREGAVDVVVPADSATTVATVEWTADGDGAVGLFLDLDGIVNWTAFVVHPDGWRPHPGLVGPTRFRVTADVPCPLRRRWADSSADVELNDVPPDQYLLGDLPVDVFDDVHVAANLRVTSPDLPWPDPLFNP